MIREAQRKDLESILALYQVLFEQLSVYEPDYMRASTQDPFFLAKVIEKNDHFICFVEEIDQEVVGFIIAQLQKTVPYNCFIPKVLGYIIDIVVDEKMRSKGIGRSLMKEVQKWGVEQQADYLELSVLSKNQRAMALYLEEGFETFNISMRMPL